MGVSTLLYLPLWRDYMTKLWRHWKRNCKSLESSRLSYVSLLTPLALGCDVCHGCFVSFSWRVEEIQCLWCVVLFEVNATELLSPIKVKQCVFFVCLLQESLSFLSNSKDALHCHCQRYDFMCSCTFIGWYTAFNLFCVITKMLNIVKYQIISH